MNWFGFVACIPSRGNCNHQSIWLCQLIGAAQGLAHFGWLGSRIPKKKTIDEGNSK